MLAITTATDDPLCAHNSARCLDASECYKARLQEQMTSQPSRERSRQALTSELDCTKRYSGSLV